MQSNLKLIHTFILKKPYVFLFLYSMAIMLFFTESSPLFVMNVWVDSQAFFTVGKGMAKSIVPYRDLFEQKGPLLYGLHALAYAISHTTFTGIYLLESAAMFVNMVCAYKISRLYLPKLPSTIISIFFPLLILNQSAFRYGDSAEEFSIPFFLLFLYMLLKQFTLSPGASFKRSFYFVNGLLIGCVFWIKFTLVGAWVGFYLAVSFIYVGKHRWGELGRAILFTFLGLVLATVPWLAYFGLNHSLPYLFNVYILFNISDYSSKISVVAKLFNAAVIFGKAFNNNFESKVIITLGLLDFMFTWKYLKDYFQKVLLLSTVFFLILGVYYGGKDFPYYFLMITPVGILGLIAAGNFIHRPFKTNTEISHSDYWFSLLLMSMATIFLCFGFNSNIKDSKLFNQETLPQESFASIMRQEPNPTLLNYGSLDGGFYFAANILPKFRYFELQNVNYHLYPENMDEQNRYVKEGEIQFIVVRSLPSKPVSQVRIPHLSDHYRLIAQQDHPFEGIDFRYLLFKKVK